MSAWDYPSFILLSAAVAIGFIVGVMRLARGAPAKPTFTCDVCERQQKGLGPKEWRFCPYCGTPKGRDKKVVGVSSWPGRFDLPVERPPRRAPTAVKPTR